MNHSVKNEIAIHICSYSVQNHAAVDALHEKLAENYVAIPEKRWMPASGDLPETVFTFLMNISLRDFLLFVGNGLAYDLLKHGSRHFLMRPAIEAINTFLDCLDSPTLADYSFSFNDAKLSIKAFRGQMFPDLSTIINTLVTTYPLIGTRDGLSLALVAIPVLRGGSEGGVSYIHSATDDLQQQIAYWGLSYGPQPGESYVLDVAGKRVLAEDWGYESPG